MSRGALWLVGNPGECRLFCAALKPRIQVRVFVPDKDRDGQALHQHLWIARLQDGFNRLCGGQTTFLSATSDYAPNGRSRMVERSASIETFLPVLVTNELRQKLLGTIIQFGFDANQDEVLAGAGIHGYRFQLLRARARGQETRDVVSRNALA